MIKDIRGDKFKDTLLLQCNTLFHDFKFVSDKIARNMIYKLIITDSKYLHKRKIKFIDAIIMLKYFHY